MMEPDSRRKKSLSLPSSLPLTSLSVSVSDSGGQRRAEERSRRDGIRREAEEGAEEEIKCVGVQ